MMNDCRDIEPLLSSFVDGQLAGDERATVIAHLDTCADCKGLVSDLERVRATARLLGPMAPPDHVWMEVAGRIQIDGDVTPFRPTARARSRSLPQWLALAAALVLVTFGVYVVDVLREPAAPVGNETATGAGGGSVEAVARELSLALEHYDNAISELQKVTQTDQAALDPDVAETLRKNISVIDRAITDSRTALKNDPTNEPARETLLDALKRKVSVLQTTVSLINEMRKGDAAGAARVAGGKG